MHATFRYYTDASDLAEGLAGNESAVRDVIGSIAGVRAYYFVRTGDSAVSVTITDDAAAGEASSKAAAGWIAENLPQLAGSPPQISSGEVVLNL
jgi:hypothetical protein